MATAEHDPAAPFDYDGPPAWRAPIAAALAGVVDPELALGILDVGLVYRVAVADGTVRVAMTMTSAACPVGDVIVEDVFDAVEGAVPEGTAVDVQLVWEPAWTPQRMSERARRFMGG